MPSKNHFTTQLVDDAEVVISASGTTSNAIDLGGTALCGVYIPSGFQGTSITFQAATAIDGSFVAVKGKDGQNISATVAASQYTALDPADFAGVRFLKIVSGTTESAQRTLKLAARPV